jgi:hypothetical protein
MTFARDLTETGQIMGTVDYMAPEQIDDTHSVDIYSLGCTLYALLAGSPPFSGPQYTTILKKIKAHDQKPPPPISEWRDDVPAEVADALMQMLAKDPADRFATPHDVADALQPFAAAADLAKLVRSLPRPKPSSAPAKTLDVTETRSQDSSPLSKTLDVAETKTHVPRDRTSSRKPIILAGLAAVLCVVALIVVLVVSANRDKSNQDVDTRGPRVDPEPASEPLAATIPEPPPLDKWLNGREILTVKQDRTAMFTKIQDALDALKPGQVVKVQDRGPYRKTLVHRDLPFDCGLVSEADTIVKVDVWRTRDKESWKGKFDEVIGHELYSGGNLRLSGLVFDFRDAEASQSDKVQHGLKIFKSHGDVIASCAFLSHRGKGPFDHVGLGLYFAKDESAAPEATSCVRDCLFAGTHLYCLDPSNVLISRNFSTDLAQDGIKCTNARGPLFICKNVIANRHGEGIRVAPSVGLIGDVTRNTLPNGRIVINATDQDHKVTVSNNIACSLVVDGTESLGTSQFVPTIKARYASEEAVVGNLFLGPLDGPEVFPVGADNRFGESPLITQDPKSRDAFRVESTVGDSLGALSLGPAPAEGDWFTRLRERWKDVLEETDPPSEFTKSKNQRR